MTEGTRRQRSRVRASRARRWWAVAGGSAVLALLIGQGLRLDLPQPPPPVPTRAAAPDEAVLTGTVRDLEALLTAWPTDAGVTDSDLDRTQVAQVRKLLTAQRRVLTGRLTNKGVPTDEILPPAGTTPATTGLAPTTTPGSHPTPTGPNPSATRRPMPADDLPDRLADVPTDRWAAIAAATPEGRILLTTAAGSRLAGAVLLGASVPLAPSASSIRHELSARTAPLVYAFEVVAAQSDGPQRTRAERTLAGLRVLDREVETGVNDPRPGGWTLPGPITDQASAHALGDTALAAALESGPEILGVLGDSPDAASVEDLARWLGRIGSIADDWGVTLPPFPGTSL